MDKQVEMDRREFIKTMALGAVAALVPMACGKPEAEKQAALPAAAAQPEEGMPMRPSEADTVYTAEAPGPWAEKVGSHAPAITAEKKGDEWEVTVVVNHGMDAETPHFIVWIEAQNAAGEMLGRQVFEATSPEAKLVFTTAEANLAGLKAFELCNLHGTWSTTYQA